MTLNLYLAHVGFYDQEIGIYELHSNFFVVAEDVRSAREKVKKKPIFQEKKMHIDAVLEINQVDGYQIALTKVEEAMENKKFDYHEIKST